MTRARILVVDDDASVLRTLQRVLEPNYTVCCANSPTQGAELAESFDPDIAICDIQMPQMNGFELLDRLRVSVPDVDVILMTGSITDQDTHLIRALRERAFYFILKPFDREVLLALIERCAEMRRLRHVEQAYSERMRQELLAAQALQQAMFAPTHASCGGTMVDVLYRPCTEVGGDFYDYVQTADGDLAFIVADVRGHGVPAALLTAMVKTLFRTAALRDDSPASWAQTLVESLGHFSVGEFITSFAGRLDHATGALKYINAGHPPALLVDRDRSQLLHSTSPFLCATFPTGSWIEAEAHLPPGARVFLYTDGYCSGLSETECELTTAAARLIAGGRRGDQILADLLRAAQVQPGALDLPADDLTLMLLTRNGR